jgi:hypothetical protein
MAKNLIVPEGQRLDLSEKVPANLADAVQSVAIESFNDLVKGGLVRSDEDLKAFLDSAQSATKAALEEPGPPRPVPGTLHRFDLQRFGRFIAGVPKTHPGEAKIFWNVARDLPPSILLSRVKVNTKLTDLRGGLVLRLLHFLDITIEPAATLVVKASKLSCGDLLIKKTGKLVVQGGGLYLKAVSIQGL